MHYKAHITAPTFLIFILNYRFLTTYRVFPYIALSLGSSQIKFVRDEKVRVTIKKKTNFPPFVFEVLQIKQNVSEDLRSVSTQSLLRLVRPSTISRL